MFGPKAKFLLPWKRLFKVSDAQVDVSIRNNAQALFQEELDASDLGKWHGQEEQGQECRS